MEPTEDQQREEYCEVLKQLILSFRQKDYATRFEMGKHLWLLQKERAKPGTERFLKDLDELGFSHWAAYRLISFYEVVMAGESDPPPEHLLQNANDAAWGEIEDVDAAERAEAQKKSDLEQKALQKYIEAEQRDVAERKAQRQAAPLCIKLTVMVNTKQEKQELQDAFDALIELLGLENASQIVRHKRDFANARYRLRDGPASARTSELKTPCRETCKRGRNMGT